MKDLSGKRFGKLLVLQPTDQRGKARQIVWLCKCDCGNTTCVVGQSLRNNLTSSCGCKPRGVAPGTLRAQGAANSKWKGGRSLKSDGYVVVWTDELTPGGHRRYRKEHVLVMEQKLGRRLSRKETVHHKNGIRSDNRPDNLELWASHHPPGQRVEDLIIFAVEILNTYKPQLLTACKPHP